MSQPFVLAYIVISALTASPSILCRKNFEYQEVPESGPVRGWLMSHQCDNGNNEQYIHYRILKKLVLSYIRVIDYFFLLTKYSFLASYHLLLTHKWDSTFVSSPNSMLKLWFKHRYFLVVRAQAERSLLVAFL